MDSHQFLGRLLKITGPAHMCRNEGLGREMSGTNQRPQREASIQAWVKTQYCPEMYN